MLTSALPLSCGTAHISTLTDTNYAVFLLLQTQLCVKEYEHTHLVIKPALTCAELISGSTWIISVITAFLGCYTFSHVTVNDHVTLSWTFDNKYSKCSVYCKKRRLLQSSKMWTCLLSISSPVVLFFHTSSGFQCVSGVCLKLRSTLGFLPNTSN